MAFTKKKWVNVSDPSNPPSIPEGQDALARFDADNMNRIEDGVDDARIHLGNTSLHNNSTSGGGALGSDANAKGGGAIGYGAEAEYGGAVGYQANVEGGGAVGYQASATYGGAVGNDATTTFGGAVGSGAKSGSGFSGGHNATVGEHQDGSPLNAIQLGEGVNNTEKSLQVYNYQLMRADGTIPDGRMPSKAPAGHGLGEIAVGTGATSFIDSMKRGSGFYQIKTDIDSPISVSEWLSLLQIVRNNNDGVEAGIQMSFYDFDTNKPEMWFRTMVRGATSDWVEMLHTGNKNLIYTYGTDDLTAGVSELETGKLYFVYE